MPRRGSESDRVTRARLRAQRVLMPREKAQRPRPAYTTSKVTSTTTRAVRWVEPPNLRSRKPRNMKAARRTAIQVTPYLPAGQVAQPAWQVGLRAVQQDARLDRQVCSRLADARHRRDPRAHDQQQVGKPGGHVLAKRAAEKGRQVGDHDVVMLPHALERLAPFEIDDDARR